MLFFLRSFFYHVRSSLDHRSRGVVLVPTYYLPIKLANNRDEAPDQNELLNLGTSLVSNLGEELHSILAKHFPTSCNYGIT